MRSALRATGKLPISFLLTYIAPAINKSYRTSRPPAPASGPGLYALHENQFLDIGNPVAEPVEATSFVSFFLWSFQCFDASTGSATTGSAIEMVDFNGFA